MAKQGRREKRPPEGLVGFTKPIRREARIDLRVTPEELEEIKETAAGLGLTISEYLRQCHQLAAKALQEGGERSG